ncbi:MAG: helix-turn-helix transcriptional regulator [Bacteroidaceae bacterium]|nr:helix-turn-helix transcriptional regulator [Bacteroidaceae bacterium]
MDKIIGRNLRFLREANRFTQEQVAECLGITRSAYSNYELGEREMPIDVLERAADLLGIELDMFFEDDEKKVRSMMACAFRIDELNATDLAQIADFKRIVKNYLKMNNLLAE